MSRKAILFDLDGTLVDTAPDLAAATDYALDRAGRPTIGLDAVRDMVGDEAEGWISLYREVLVTGTPIRFERELEATERYLSLYAFRLDPPEKRQVGVLFQDITARKKAQTELIEFNRSLEQRVEEERERFVATEEALRQA